jgi:flagellar motor switch protein FliN
MPLFGRSVAFAAATVHLVEDADALPADLAQSERLWAVRARVNGGDGLRADLVLTIGSALGREILALGAGDGMASGGAAPRQGASFPSKIDLVLDVTLPVTVELGRARMQVQDVLKLAPGSVIELDKAAGDPVDLYINDRAIAKGEVVIIDENFGVRLTAIVTATERIKTLR